MNAPGIPEIGVAEEFHVVDLATRSLVARAPELLRRLPGTSFVEELQTCIVERQSGMNSDLRELRAELREQRTTAASVAGELGLGVVAAGAVPLSTPAAIRVTDTRRYRRMAADFAMLAREQLICGAHFTVAMPNPDDADETIAVARRLAPDLPVLLALSASSPFDPDGSDTGYASSRALIWSRWPATGPRPPARTADEYRLVLDRMVSSGVIPDRDMAYFDIRPSEDFRHLELRICDSCPELDNVELIAALFRALVLRAVDDIAAGVPDPDLASTLIQAARWRAARFGLEGELSDLSTFTSRPAHDVVRDLVGKLEPQLGRTGDLDTVRELLGRVLHVGSSASRQRRALNRRGRLVDVVDDLIGLTRGRLRAPVAEPELDDDGGPRGYRRVALSAGGYAHDEAVDDDGAPRPAMRDVFTQLADLGQAELRRRHSQMERQETIDGVVFGVGDGEQVFPLDVVPRIISAEDWGRLSRGLEQRATALNLFLDDLYTRQLCLRDRIIPGEVLDRAPGYRRYGRAARHRVRANIIGSDIVCSGPGEWLVLEDNCRIPSGTTFSVAARDMSRRFLPEMAPPGRILEPVGAIDMFRETLLAAAPSAIRPGGWAPVDDDDVQLGLVSAGRGDPTWYEQSELAKRCGMALVTPEELVVEGDVLLRVDSDGRQRRIDVLYQRMDDDMLMTSKGADGALLGPGLTTAQALGTLTVANAMGNGVADDKAVYSFVPDSIRYYMSEEPLLPQVPTYLCADREQRDYVLENIGDLVVKPIDGYGGSGVTIGPECTDAELAERADELRTHPERYIGQPAIGLSTHPTFDGTGLGPRHVDARVFVHSKEEDGVIVSKVSPAPFTRVAPEGSMIVNSSRGGGAKDTWVLEG